MMADPDLVYNEVQTAWPFLAGGIVLLVVLLYLAITLSQPIATLAVLILGSMLAVFSTMRTSVNDKVVEIQFGPLPLVNKTVSLDTIKGVQVSRASWWNGWGIRRIDRGWLYNVLSLRVVELELPDNRRIQIGISDPARLKDAITKLAAFGKS